MTQIKIQNFVKMKGESPEILSKKIGKSLATVYNWMNSKADYIIHYDARNGRIQKIEMSTTKEVFKA